MCPGLCVLRFKYLASPTRCTTETTVGTGLPNHCLHQANWFYFLNSFISSLLCCVLVISVFEDFDWRLSQFPQFNFFSLFVFILCYPVFTLSVLSACLHLIMTTMLVFCYACIWILIPLLSSLLLRNFLTLKFLSYEFVKIAYSPPSSRYNALSIVKARHN